MARFYEGVSLEAMIERFKDNYLTKTGWLKSAESKESVSNTGPVPWYTYPAISYLDKLDLKSSKLFEFGSGNSSLWWADRVQEVTSVEHDQDWFNELNTAIENVNLIYSPKSENTTDELIQEFIDDVCTITEMDEGDMDELISKSLDYKTYVYELSKFQKRSFDLIVIDGRARVLSTYMALEYINADGLIIFDNSDREEYLPAFKILEKNGYARIDFWGCGPINPYEWCTSIFTRSLKHFT